MRADRAILLCGPAALASSGCVQSRGPMAFAPRYATATAQPAALTYSPPPDDTVNIAEWWH